MDGDGGWYFTSFYSLEEAPQTPFLAGEDSMGTFVLKWDFMDPLKIEQRSTRSIGSKIKQPLTPTLSNKLAAPSASHQNRFLREFFSVFCPLNVINYKADK